MNFDYFLKCIDFFGINFDFRMKNYEKYKTKTGGILFIIYFLSSTIYSLFIIMNYFTNPSYTRDYYEKYTNNTETDNNDYTFNFALKVPDFKNISIRDFLIYKAKYRIRNTSRISSRDLALEKSFDIPTKVCDRKLFEKYAGEKLDIPKSEVICFDMNQTYNLIGDQFSNHTYIDINVYVNKTRYCEYQKSMINILKKDTFYINLLFPHNIMQDDFKTNIQSLDGIFLYINERNKVLTDLYLRKDIFRLDNNVLYSDPTDKILMNYYYHLSNSLEDDTYYNTLNNTMGNTFDICGTVDQNLKILRIYIRNNVIYSVHVKTRVKLNALVDKVMSIY